MLLQKWSTGRGFLFQGMAKVYRGEGELEHFVCVKNKIYPIPPNVLWYSNDPHPLGINFQYNPLTPHYTLLATTDSPQNPPTPPPLKEINDDWSLQEIKPLNTFFYVLSYIFTECPLHYST